MYLRRSQVYDQTPVLDVANVSPAKFKEANVRTNTAASVDVVMAHEKASSIAGGSVAGRSSQVPGYTIPKLPEQDPRKNINILNWKTYKLPARGK